MEGVDLCTFWFNNRSCNSSLFAVTLSSSRRYSKITTVTTTVERSSRHAATIQPTIALDSSALATVSRIFGMSAFLARHTPTNSARAITRRGQYSIDPNTCPMKYRRSEIEGDGGGISKTCFCLFRIEGETVKNNRQSPAGKHNRPFLQRVDFARKSRP